jgi:hypothetical protein
MRRHIQDNAAILDLIPPIAAAVWRSYPLNDIVAIHALT